MLSYGPAVLILFSVVVSIFFDRRNFATLRTHMASQFDHVDKQYDQMGTRVDALTARVSSLGSDYTRFYGMQQKMEGRLDEISSRVQ